MSSNAPSMETPSCNSNIVLKTEVTKENESSKWGFLSQSWQAIKYIFMCLSKSLYWCYSKTVNFFTAKAATPTQKQEEQTPLQYLIKLRETKTSVNTETTTPSQTDALEEYLKSVNMLTQFSLNPPQGKPITRHITDIKEQFEEKLQNWMLTLLGGGAGSETISDGSDLLKLVNFAKTQLERFNNDLKVAVMAYNNVSASVPMRLPFRPIEAWKGLKDLETLANNWLGLRKFENKEYLDEFDLNSLRSLINAMPVKIEYASLNQKLYNQLVLIANRPVFSRYAGLYNEVFGSFTDKINCPFIQRLSLELWLKKGHQKCIAKLEAEIQQTFATYGKRLALKDAQEILAAARSELEKDHKEILKQLDSWQTKEHPDFEPSDAPKYAFADLANLLDIWKEMQKLTSDEYGMDEKIEILEGIRERLDSDHAINKYPIKEAMEATLQRLNGALFATRELSTISEEDQVRKKCIMSGINAITQKLGCEGPMTEDIVMNQDDDAMLLNLEGEAAFQEMAQHIQTQYYESMVNSPQTAEQDASGFLRSFVESYKDKVEKQRVFVLVFSKIDPEVANLMKPHLLDLFPPESVWEKLKKIVQSRILSKK